LTVEEVRSALARLQSEPWLGCNLLYATDGSVAFARQGCGFSRHEIPIRDGKGMKDRAAMI